MIGNDGRCHPLFPALDPGVVPGGFTGDVLGFLGSWKDLVIRIAIGAGGLALILVGAMMISADLTASEAASRLGKALKETT